MLIKQKLIQITKKEEDRSNYQSRWSIEYLGPSPNKLRIDLDPKFIDPFWTKPVVN